jgi:uncharacterized cupin superfamily protein
MLQGAALVIALGCIVYAISLARAGLHSRSPVHSWEAPLENLTVDAAWISDGKPAFRASSFAQSPTGTVSGIWECEGPAKFRWEYTVDETLYVLEGGAELEYQGVTYVLRPGTAAFFPAGVSVNWTVTSRIRKAFSLDEPGHARRLMRRLFAAAPVVQ